jgi:hypothetical protein
VIRVLLYIQGEPSFPRSLPCFFIMTLEDLTKSRDAPIGVMRNDAQQFLSTKILRQHVNQICLHRWQCSVSRGVCRTIQGGSTGIFYIAATYSNERQERREACCHAQPNAVWAFRIVLTSSPCTLHLNKFLHCTGQQLGKD